jgi:LysM repeat protein
MTPNREYDFKVPEGGSKLMIAELDRIPQWEAPKQPSREYARKSVHRVRKGESLNSIARKYKVSAQDIAAFNNLQGKVRVGQRLKIPGRAVDPGYAKKSGGKTKGGREAASAGYYKVKRGDTLASIAERYDTTPAELKKLNNMKSGKVTRNKVIKVPQKRVAQKDPEKKKENDCKPAASQS